MNKAFTKEEDGPEADRLPDLPQSPHPNYVTPGGLAALERRLADLRAGLAHLLDRRADLDERQAIAVARRDIRYVEERIARAILVHPKDHPKDEIAFGAEIMVVDEDGRERTYRIVGEDESDPSRGEIAVHSPLAQALVGARIGDVVEWPRPSGAVDLQIVNIFYRR